jgi:hypothetical protein
LLNLRVYGLGTTTYKCGYGSGTDWYAEYAVQHIPRTLIAHHADRTQGDGKRSYIPAVLHLAFKLLRELSAQFLTVHIWAAADHCAMFGYFFINNYINFIA